MRKTALLLFIFVSAILQASPVSSRQAAMKAEAFLASRNLQGQTLTLAMQGRQKTIGKGGSGSQPYYYVFNRGDDGGFVIVSGDDDAEEILGYSDRGSFDLAHIPDNMRTWLDGYAEEIEWVQQHPVEGKRRTARTSATGLEISRMEVAPLIETTWGQDNPYNMRCQTTSGSSAVTGCVATALAQIMYYHKWPQEETDTIPAYSYYPELDPIIFDWGRMQLSYDKTDYSESPANLAVADLMLYCGHAVQMSYDATSSGADAMKSADALNMYFGYANPALSASRSAYSDEEWEELVYAELAAGRPVFYAAQNSNGAGHAFVCDGYDGNGLFHINWGWNGMSDGFFRLQALNPTAQGIGGSNLSYGFSTQQMMIFGISPSVLETEPEGLRPPIVQVVDLSLAGSTSELEYTGASFSDISVNHTFRVPVAEYYALGLALCQGDEMLQVQFLAADDLPSSYDMRFRNPVSLRDLGKDLPDGEYQIKCVCKAGDEENWKFDTDSERIFMNVTIADGKATFSSVMLHTTLDVIKVEQQYDHSSFKQIRATIENDGPYDFCGPIQLYVDGVRLRSENLQLTVNHQDVVDFMFNTSNNPVDLKIIVGESREVIYENEAFTFVDPPVTAAPEVTSCVVRSLDEENHRMFGNTAEAAVTLHNESEESWTGFVSLVVNFFSAEEGDRPDPRVVRQRVTLHAGETREVTVSCPNLSYGSEVWFDVSLDEYSNTIGNEDSPYTVTVGYEEWDAYGVRQARELAASTTISPSAVAVRFTGSTLADVELTPNDNPNTLYFLDQDADIPATLAEKNVVKGYKAVGDIVWQQGYAYYVPTSFEVDEEICYIRTPHAACDEYVGWETVSLPYTVQKMMIDDEEYHWTGDDEDGFWVRSLEGVDGEHLTFKTVRNWKANEPYIIGVPEEMSEKPLKLVASNVRIQKTAASSKSVDGYRFVATTADQTFASAYVINAAGDAFQLTENVTVRAGEAYIIAETAAPDTPTSLFINRRLAGDVDRNGVVNMTDVLLMVSYILGEEPLVFDVANADVNSDETVSVTDVMQVIDMLIPAPKD